MPKGWVAFESESTGPALVRRELLWAVAWPRGSRGRPSPMQRPWTWLHRNTSVVEKQVMGHLEGIFSKRNRSSQMAVSVTRRAIPLDHRY